MHSERETIDALVLEKLGLPTSAGAIDPKVALFDLGLTSLQVVDLIFLLEDRLGLTIPDDDINSENFHSTGSMLSLITRLQCTAQTGKSDGRR